MLPPALACPGLPPRPPARGAIRPPPIWAPPHCLPRALGMKVSQWASMARQDARTRLTTSLLSGLGADRVSAAAST